MFESDERRDEAVHIKVLLVDQQPIARAGLRFGLERVGGIEVIGETDSGAAAVEMTREFEPDLVWLDLGTSEQDGVSIAQAISLARPLVRLAFISGAFDEDQLLRCLNAGARGFILKTESPAMFSKFTVDVFHGRFCCSPALSTLLNPGPDGFRMARNPSRAIGALTSREREMLTVLVKGASLKQAALSIGVSYKAADHIKQSLMKKLDIHDRVALVRFAMQNGLII